MIIMSNITNCKKIETAINRAEKVLIKRAKSKGLYENFGQEEIREIKDKFINSSDYSSDMNNNRDMLQGFANWCRNVGISEINSY